MALITGEELARGLIIGTLGGAAGLCVVAFPGSALWLAPAALAVGGCALTVPEVRAELAPIAERARPLLTDAQQRLGSAAWQLPGVRRPAPALPAPAQAQARDDRRPEPAARAARPGTAAATQERPRWLEVVNDEPDRYPHTLIIGDTGAGKTTMAKAIMGDRGGRVVVLAPKVSRKGWKGSGAEVISLDRDATYAPITQALQDIDEEKRRRSRLLQDEDDPYLEPLTIVLDDIQDLLVKEPKAGELMVNLSGIGRELNMRLIGIGTSDDALGVKQWKASRNNYVRIETDATRRGTLNDRTRTMTIRADESLALAERAQLRPWRGEPEPQPQAATRTTTNLRAPAADPQALLGGLLDTPLPATEAALATVAPERRARLQALIGPQQSVTVDRGGDGQVIVNVAQVAGGFGGRGRTAAEEAYSQALIELYRAAGASGRTFKEVYAQHKGTKEIVFPAWQEGCKARMSTKERSEAS